MYGYSVFHARRDCSQRKEFAPSESKFFPIREVPIFQRDVPGSIAQSETCLATDESLTVDPGVVSSIPARSHTFMEIDHEIIFTVILPPSAESFNVVVSNKRKYVHEVLVNCLFQLAHEKVWLGELTIPP